MITEEFLYFSVHAHPAPVFFRFKQILAEPTYDQAVLRRGKKGRSFSPLPDRQLSRYPRIKDARSQVKADQEL